MPLSDQTLSRAEELIARYPQRRSALLPILFLLQAEDGYVSPAGVAQVAELLGLTKAEVGAVATFYTMFRRRPVGKYLVSVCKTLPCELRGSREISRALCERLEVPLPKSDLLLRFRRAVAERRRYHGLRRTTRDVLDGIKYLHHVATSMRTGRLDVEEAAREIDATEVRLHQLVSQLRAVAGVEP